MAGALRHPIMTAMNGRETTSVVTRGLRFARVFAHLLQGLLIVALLFPFFSRA
ncbi:MAG: hypothetical protein RLZZ445_2154, partial [Pseudomonadota bacterium]